jgi:endonuclease G
MVSKNNKRRTIRRFKPVIVLALVYVCGTVGYYFLPWSVRQRVYRVNPGVDRALRKTGFNIVRAWDELGLWGRDCRTMLSPDQRGHHAYGGFPSQGLKLIDRVNVLENVGYTVGYSDSMHDPLWVLYRVFDVPILESGKRPSRFRIDYRTKSKISHGDYTHSGYDRGHMAPNYAIATRYGMYGQRETFLMSNIIPQNPRVNRHIWKDLEMSVARRYGRYFGEVWVITGPVFKKPIERLGSGVAIPSAYYKILVDEDGDELRAKAFLVASDCPPYTRIKSHLVSIDELEELTHLDFFPELSKEAQSELESRPAGRLWPWLGSSVRYHLGRKPR